MLIRFADVSHSRLPIVIVGAGPVGLSAAAALSHFGIQSVVLERTDQPQTDWRASTFPAATLELLTQINITGGMLAEGLQVPRYQFRDRTEGLVAEFDLGVLSDETPYPFRLQLNQQRFVAMLYEQLTADPNVTLLFGSEATSISQWPGSAVVAVSGSDGPTDIEALYVIGADGPASVTRKSAGITMEGITFEERFLIVSTPWDLRDLLPGICEVNYISDPDEWLFILRTPDAWRVLWPVGPDVSDDVATDPQTIQKRLQSVAKAATDYPIIDTQIYRIHQRVATTFRDDRVLIIGDAAHLNSPVGGVGLNSGIHDAFDLACRLDRIMNADADADAELNTFAAVRRKVALEYVQADTQRNTDRMRERDPELRSASATELREISADLDKSRNWLRRVSLLESVQKYGIGRPPSELTASEDPALTGMVEA